jgi:peptidoglycan/LPS O-acetylase OafA/YrhL
MSGERSDGLQRASTAEYRRPLNGNIGTRDGAPRTSGVSAPRRTALDGLRAVAVGVVFIHHVNPQLFPGGFLGVDLFFALSGYLITSLLLLEWERAERLWLFGFYVRRALRLMPALLAMVTIMAPVGILLGETRLIDATSTLTYLMNFRAFFSVGLGGVFAHTWSLALEEQFYLVCPLLLLVGLRRRWNMSKLVGLLIVEFTLVTALAQWGGHGLGYPGLWELKLYRLPTTHVPELGAGVLLAFALRQGKGRKSRWARIARRPATAGTVLGGLVLALFVLRADSEWLYFGGFTLAGIGAAVLISHLLLAPSSAITRTFRFAPAVWLGQRSYGFYLWHYPVLILLAREIDNAPLRGVLGLCVTLALTEVSWRYVEQPFLRLKCNYEPTLHEPNVPAAKRTRTKSPVRP